MSLLKKLSESMPEDWKTIREKSKKNSLMSRGEMCPKCENTNINKIKAKSWWTSALRGKYYQEMFNRSKDLYVCKDCGFSWESR